MASEKRLVRQVIEELSRRGFWTLKVHGGPMQKAGIPDVLAVRDGCLWAVECKTWNGTVSRLQRKRMHELESFGVRVCVVRSVEELVYFLGGDGNG